MQLIGMLDSPFVRRTAISLNALGIEFEHHPVSVFSHFEDFQKINPVVKAPTLVFDNGDYMMDSSLIVQYFETQLGKQSLLWGTEKSALHFRTVSLALAACDKSVQIVYERNLRPEDIQFQPWVDRVLGQLTAALTELESTIKSHPEIFTGSLNQATISTVVTWTFIQNMLKGTITPDDFPMLRDLTERTEKLPPFQLYGYGGPGVPSK